jgi:hypothetical protein
MFIVCKRSPSLFAGSMNKAARVTVRSVDAGPDSHKTNDTWELGLTMRTSTIPEKAYSIVGANDDGDNAPVSSGALHVVTVLRSSARASCRDMLPAAPASNGVYDKKKG